MSRPRALRERVASLFRRQRLDDDFADELAAHLEMATEDGIRAGLDPREARRQASLRLGGLEPTRELHRETRGLPLLESVAQDVRFAFRTLGRSPGFTAMAVGILALGIGGTTAIFSLVSAVLLRPLPFVEPERLVVLWEDYAATGARGGLSRVEPAPASYAQWKERSRSFADLAALERRVYNLTGQGEPEKLVGLRVSGNLFSLLGLKPVLGRTFAPEDEGPDAAPAVVVAERFWRRRLGGAYDVLGRQIRLNDLPHTVVGVVPNDFQFPDRDTAVWLPAAFTAGELASRGGHWYVVGRLGPGVGIGQAQAEMTAIARQLADERRDSSAGIGVSVTRLHDQLARGARPALLSLLGAVALVLLVACANVANLLLARGARREKELALRQALGAGRTRVFRLVLTENVVLAGLGTIAGAALCAASLEYLQRLVPEMSPHGVRPILDSAVLAFAAGVAGLAVLLSGTGPALAAARVGLSEALRRGARTATAARGNLRHALVAAEVALTVVLLAGAGLFLRSYQRATAVDPGFDAAHLLVAETALPPLRYGTWESRTAFYRDVLERVRALPRVAQAGYVNYPPLTLKEGRGFVTIEGQPPPLPEQRARNVVSWRVASAGYLPALGAPLLAGRPIETRDGPEAPPVVVVNQAMARLHWPGVDPVGRRLKLGQAQGANPWCTVVGVVGDVRQMGLEVPPEPEVYFPLDQPTGATPFFWPQHLVVRTEGDPMAVTAALREAVWEVDPDQPVSNVRTMSEVVGGELSVRGTQTTLVTAFAALALLLSAVGLYAVQSYDVSQRTAEIGVRMALGAPPRALVVQVVGRALAWASAGVALGLAAALALTRLVASLLFGVEPWDPVTFVAVPFLLLVVALLASSLPAHRAAGVDPITALRAE